MPHGVAVSTSVFDTDDMGSNPVGAVIWELGVMVSLSVSKTVR